MGGRCNGGSIVTGPLEYAKYIKNTIHVYCDVCCVFQWASIAILQPLGRWGGATTTFISQKMHQVTHKKRDKILVNLLWCYGDFFCCFFGECLCGTIPPRYPPMHLIFQVSFLLYLYRMHRSIFVFLSFSFPFLCLRRNRRRHA